MDEFRIFWLVYHMDARNPKASRRVFDEALAAFLEAFTLPLAFYNIQQV